MGMTASWSSIYTVTAVFGLFYVVRRIIQRLRKVSVKDKVVVITGASSGLGEACVRTFHAAGAKVIMCARRKNELEKIKLSLCEFAKPGQHEPHILLLDLKEFDQMGLKAEQAMTVHGQVDVLINNGGVSYRGEIFDTSLLVDQNIMSVNYFGQVALTKAFLPYMVLNKQSHIVMVSSLQGKISIPFRSAYSASKHALQAFADCLRAEMADKNIRVSTISPGYIQTNLSLNALTANGGAYGIMDSTTASGMKPSYAASKILSAVENYTKDCVLATPVHSAAVYLRTILPSVFFWLMTRKAKKQTVKRE